MRRIILVLLTMATTAWAAQPTLTTITSLSGTEDTAIVISYSDLVNAANESANTTRFKIVSLNSGTLLHRAAGSSATWTNVTPPWFFTNLDELQWMPVTNTNGLQSPCALRANNGDGDAATDNSVADVSLFVNLAPVADYPTAQSAANKRTASTTRLITVTEDTWAQFSFASLTTLTQAADYDGDALQFVITALGDGTLAKSSGGAALAVNDTIAAGESLWWRPSADTYTKQGATAADDEPPVTVARLKARKVSSPTYASAEITLSSTIDGVPDPFANAVSGCNPITVTRGTYIQLTAQGWISHLTGFANTDRNAFVHFNINGADADGWMVDSYTTAGVHMAHLDGSTNTSIGIADGESMRLTPPSALAVRGADYLVGYISVLPGPGSPGSSSASVIVPIHLIEPSNGGSGSGGGGSGGCGGGGLSALLLGCLLAIGCTLIGRQHR